MDFNIQGVTEKMFLGEKDAYLTKEHLFWDTWYIAIELMRNLQCDSSQFYFLNFVQKKIVVTRTILTKPIHRG